MLQGIIRGQAEAALVSCTLAMPTTTTQRDARGIVDTATFAHLVDPSLMFTGIASQRNHLLAAPNISENQPSTLHLLRRSLSNWRLGGM